MAKKVYAGASVLALTIAAAAVAGPAWAQDEASELEAVVVTGSFIRGTPEDAALPVDVIGSEDWLGKGNPARWN